MDKRIFMLPPMGLKDDLLSKPISERMVYDPKSKIFFVNFVLFVAHSFKASRIASIVLSTSSL